MLEVTHDVEIDDEEGPQFKGSFVVNIPKRGERLILQMKAAKAGQNIEEDPTLYAELSDEILDKYLISIDVVHVPSEEELKTRESLEYVQVETLVAEITKIVTGGRQLGKKKP